MADRLFVFAGRGVASEPSGYPVGARHPLMVFAAAANFEAAVAAAAEFATLAGWLDLEFTKGDVSLDPDLLPNEKLKAAAERAREAGHALVVYETEITRKR
jgi:hypothetical protein